MAQPLGPMVRVHATCAELDGAAVLLRGPSGSGKSDLALRLIDCGARLVADDQVELRVEDGALLASCPAALAGLLEVRGIGPVTVTAVRTARLALVIDLAPADAMERLPEPAFAELLGLRIPLLRLWPFAASTPAKIRLALKLAASGRLNPVDFARVGPAA